MAAVYQVHYSVCFAVDHQTHTQIQSSVLPLLYTIINFISFQSKGYMCESTRTSSRRRRGRWWGLVERNLLRTAEHFMGSSLLSSDAHKVKVVQVVGNRVAHVLIISLSTHLISVENIHGSPKTWDPLGQGVILGGLPAPNEDIMGWRLVLLRWSHPSPNCSLKGQGGILFNVFRVVQ